MQNYKRGFTNLREISHFILEKKDIKKEKELYWKAKILSFDICVSLLKLKRNSQIRTSSHFHQRLRFNGDTIGTALKEWRGKKERKVRSSEHLFPLYPK